MSYRVIKQMPRKYTEGRNERRPAESLIATQFETYDGAVQYLREHGLHGRVYVITEEVAEVSMRLEVDETQFFAKGVK